MTRMMIVRRDQLLGESTLREARAGGAAAASSFSGRVSRVPSPISSV